MPKDGGANSKENILVNLPKELVRAIDKIVGSGTMFTSRSDFIAKVCSAWLVDIQKEIKKGEK